MAKEKRKNMLTRDQMKEFIKDNEIQSVDDIQMSTSRKNVTKTPDYGQFQEFFTFTA